MFKQALAFLVAGFMALTAAQGHLIVDQKGTLNFVDDGAFLVISLPVTAFEGSDDDGDGRLSFAEMARHTAAIQRQIIASTSFMPMTDEARVFDLLVYTNEDVETPGAWEESDAREFQENQSEQVQLRTLDTTKHKVESFVSYRLVED